MPKYIALTIGPIYKTLAFARKTRELWGASYMFSYLMKKITETIPDKNIILPSAETEIYTLKHNGVGLFPDRLIFNVENSRFDFDSFVQHIKNVKTDFAKKSFENNTDAQKFVNDYLQIYFFEHELNETENPILKLSPMLDAMELQAQFVGKEKQNHIATFLDRVNNSFLVEDAFNKTKQKFLYLLKISTEELNRNDETKYKLIFQKAAGKETKEEQELIINNLKTAFKDDFRSYHKYIAIVHADGDFMGKVIGKLENKNLPVLSKSLFRYGKMSAQLIENYGGLPIYAGGDDLLFFAPVANKNENIFGLLNEIDERFKKEIIENKELVEIIKTLETEKHIKPSLSYGISISYYKYPMNEALENSRNLLFDVAKKFKTKNKVEKNAVAFRVLKHSGQFFEATFNKESDSYKSLLKLIAATSSENDILSSVPYKILSQPAVLQEIASDRTRIEYYIANNYNESVHKNYKDFFKNLADFIFHTFNEYDSKKSIDVLYSGLRMVKFLIQKDNE